MFKRRVLSVILSIGVILSSIGVAFADSTKVDVTSSGSVSGIETMNENARLQIEFTNDYDDVVHNNIIDNYVLEFDFDGQGSLTGTNLLKTGNHYKVAGTNLKKGDSIILNYDGKLNDKDVNNVRLYPASEPCKSWNGANGTAYTKGQVVVFDGKHYECISNHSVIIDQAAPWQAGKTYNLGELVSCGGAVYKVKSTHTAALDTYTTWQMSNTYRVGDIVERNGKYYQVKEEHTPQLDKILNWNITSAYNKGDIVKYNNKYYEVKAAYTPYLETVPAWNPANTYNTGDKVSFNGGYYECTGSHTAQGTIGVISGRHAVGDYFLDNGTYYKVTQAYNLVIINNFFDMSPHLNDIVYCKETNNYYLCSRDDSTGRGYTIYGSGILIGKYIQANINEICAAISHWKPYAIRNEAYWAPSNTANNLFQSYTIKDEAYWAPENYKRAFTPYILKDVAYWNPRNYTDGFEAYTLRGVDYWNPQNYSAGFKQIAVEKYDYSANVKLNYTIILDSSLDEDSEGNPIQLPQGNDLKASYSVKTGPLNGTASIEEQDGNWRLTYTPTSNFNGTDLVVLNQNNSDGQVIETKINITINPVNDPPNNLILPSVTGSYSVGQTLIATTGQWEDNIDIKPGKLGYTYQWQRKPGMESTNITDITGATSGTYILTTDDRDEYIRVKITCTDDGEGLPYSQSTTAFSTWEKVGSPAVSIDSCLVVSSNKNNGFAKIGDTITLTITPSEEITAPKVMISGSMLEVTPKGETVWSAVYQMNGDSIEGYIPVTISDYAAKEKNADGKSFDGSLFSLTSSVRFDKTKPSITIKGDSTTSIIVGEKYIDLGASATDNFDTINDEQILVDSNVNPLVPGSYSVVYSVSDSAGNAADPVTRTVNVISNNADLTGISPSEGKLTPVFSPLQTEYQINVPSITQSISVTASVYDAGASIEGGNTRVLELKIGDNDMKFTVTAQDQKTQKTYKVRVVRADYTNVVTNRDTSSQNGTPTTPPVVIAPEKTIPEALPVYHDIKGHWAEKDILELIKDKAVGGYEDGTIKPDAAITRAEMAKLIVSVLKLKLTNTFSNHFKDEGEFADWAKPYIETALEKKLMIGYDDNSFKASKDITREEAVAVLMRAFAIGKPQSTKLSFTDAGDIHSWAREYVVKAVEMNIVKGYPGNMFYPEKKVTRAEAFVMINRLVES